MSGTPLRTALLIGLATAGLRGWIATAQVDRERVRVRSEFDFGFEQGHLAGNLARGLSYSVRLGDGPPVPSAWASPMYPLLLAGIFRVAGVFTVESAILVTWCNAAFHGVVAGLLYVLGTRLASRAAGGLAAGLFFVLPGGWQFLHWAWGAHLMAVWVLLHLFVLTSPSRGTLRHAAAAGTTLGLAMLTDGAAVTLAPLAAWCMVRTAPKGVLRTVTRLSVLLAAGLFVLSPWIVRNGLVLHAWSPLRGMLGAALWMGNHPGAEAEDFHGVAENPWHNPDAARRYVALGERGFDRDCRRRFLDETSRDPMRFVRNSALRASGFWCSEWWVGWRNYPPHLSAGLVLSAAMAAVGALHGRRRGLACGPYVAVLLLFPMPYYVTFLSYGRYRFPIEPVMLLLAAAWLAEALPRAAAARRDQPLAGRVSPSAGT